MLSKDFREGITEVLEIIENMEDKYKKRIPDSFMNYLKQNKSNEYKPGFNTSKKLNELNLKSETKNLLGLIYYKYLSDSVKKQEFIKKLNENENK